jgi:hypothetical protein
MVSQSPLPTGEMVLFGVNLRSGSSSNSPIPGFQLWKMLLRRIINNQNAPELEKFNLIESQVLLSGNMSLILAKRLSV